MSNALAIAAVTASLRNLLTQGVTADPNLVDATVTMQPLDRARANGNNANQLNIFLYHVLPSPTWRNLDVPGRTHPGETSVPALGLNLYYLLTAFGRDNDTQGPFSHQLMGRAMSTLYDHPLLSADEIKAALPNNDLWTQVERVRITLQPFSIEEVAKLWTGFQTQYRLSVAYEAAVVLIESTRAISAPLPVLTRGPADSGIIAQADLLPPFATILQITPPNQQPTAALGDVLTIMGHNLSVPNGAVSAQFLSPRLSNPLVIAAQGTPTDTQVTVMVPNDPANWPAGTYAVTVVISVQGQPDLTTNSQPLGISPKITNKMPLTIKRNNKGVATINITCSPEVRPEQQVSLLLGSLAVSATPLAAQSSKLSFVIPNAVAGTYIVRLRVDGTDTQVINRAVTPPTFDQKQQVTIQ